MALTDLQRRLCRLLAQNRIASGESYVAGGVALNESLGATRLSRDIDPFHDTNEALESSWQADRTLLEESGMVLRVLRERAGIVEAEEVGTCVLDAEGRLLRADAKTLAAELASDRVRFYRGSIRGALPRLLDIGPG